MPVAEKGHNLWTNILTTAATVSSATSGKLLEVKEYILDTLAWTAAKVILDKFTDSLVMWIQSGFQGSPMFVTNPGRFLKDVGNDISGDFIDELNLEFLCEPLGKFVFDINFFFPGTSRSKYNCTFSDIADNFKEMADRGLGDWVDINVNITQENIVREYNKDFRSGGWAMWLASADPKNNPYGRLLTAADDVYSRSGEKKEEERQQVQTGRGFLGMKVCVRYDTRTTYTEAKPEGFKKCLEYKTTTPGAIVSDQMSKVTGLDMDRLNLADEINEVIGALAYQLVSWVITGGSGGQGIAAYTPQADARQRNITNQQRENSEIIRVKTSIITEVDEMKKWKSIYRDAKVDQWRTLSGAKAELEKIKTKLPSGSVVIVNNLSTEDQIRLIESEMALASTTAAVAIAISDKIFEILNNFGNELLLASDRNSIDVLKDKYCYLYNKTQKNGEICERETLPPPQAPKITKYATYSQREAENALKESVAVVAKMDDLVTKYECILNTYTGVIDAKCEE